MKPLILLIFSLLIFSCGGGSSSNVQLFSLRIQGEWSGDLQQSNLRCVSSDGSVMFISACSGCTLGATTYTISGGDRMGDRVQITDQDGCVLTGFREDNDQLEVYPESESCSFFLTRINFTIHSASSASYVQHSSNPTAADVTGEPICVLDAVGDLTLNKESSVTG